jgi:hypothetical protein
VTQRQTQNDALTLNLLEKKLETTKDGFYSNRCPTVAIPKMRSRDYNSSWHTCAEDEDRKVADARKTGETNEGRRRDPRQQREAPREEEEEG